MKQNVMKRTLAGVLAVLTVAAYMPANVGGFLTESTGIVMGVSAEEATSVSTAGALKTAVEAGESVQLAANITLTETLNVTEDVTIDLDGHSITADGCRAFHVKSGTLMLSGSGTVSSTHTDGDNFGESSSVIRVGDGKETTKTGSTPAGLYVDSGVTISTDWCYGISVFGSKTTETVDIYGKVLVTGTASAVSGNGNLQNTGTTINIYPGAVVSAANDVAIYHPQAGTLNITGGTITGLGGVVARAGNINVSGGTFTCTGTEAGKVGDYKTLIPRSALVFDEVANYPGLTNDAKISVTGGTFKTASGVDAVTTINNVSRISITGGRFISGSQKTDVSAYFDIDTYSQDDYGYVRETAAICWDEIEDATGKTLFSVDPTYLTINNATVKLRKDATTKQIYVPNGYTGTIDLNGHDLTLNGYGFVGYNSTENSYADLTIKNSGENGGNINAKVVQYSENESAMFVNGYSTLTIGENVSFATTADYGIYYKNNSTVNVYGSVSSSGNGAAISGNGNNPSVAPNSNSYMSTLNIYEGATVSCENGNAIYHPQYGTVNISGGSVSSGKTAIYQRAGTINITGGTFNGNGEANAPGTVANGADPTGDAIAVQAFTGSYMSLPELNISGGSFISKNADAIGSYTYQSNGLYPTITITGGSFNTKLDAAYIAEGYYQDGNVVKADERQDISNAKIEIVNGKTRRYNSYEWNITDDIYVEFNGKSLTKGTDFEIYEGDTKATDVGTYVFKIRGKNNYKGELVGNWTIDNTVRVYVGNNPGKDYQYGQSVTVTPYGPWSGNSCWEAWTGNGNDGWEIVSYSQNYSFIALKDVELRVSEYTPDSDLEKSVLTMSTSKTKYNGKSAIKFTFNHSVDSKYTVKEVGLIYGTNKLVGADTTKAGYANADLSVDGAKFGVANLEAALKNNISGKVKTYRANYKKANGTVELSYSLGGNEEAYANAVGYVKVYDPSKNETKTLYTDVAATNYNKAQ